MSAEDLTQFDSGFKPSTGTQSNLDQLEDGEYEMLCVAPKLKGIKGGAIVEAPMMVIGGPHDGFNIVQSWWLNDQDKVNMFAGDLGKMGFDPENWKGDRRFSAELPKALKVMEGMKLKTKKVTNESGGKKYHNLRIVERGKDGKPEKITEAMLNEAVADAFS